MRATRTNARRISNRIVRVDSGRFVGVASSPSFLARSYSLGEDLDSPWRADRRTSMPAHTRRHGGAAARKRRTATAAPRG